MRPLVLCAIFFITAPALPIYAKVIASCGEFSGYSYFHQSALAPDKTPRWTKSSIQSGTTLITKTDDKLDVVHSHTDSSGKRWTRSASDYGAPVYVVNQSGQVHHILVTWSADTELYALDTARKTLTLVSHKHSLLDVTHAMVAKCE